MSTMWNSAKKFFGRMKFRRNNRVGPCGEDGLNPDPSYQLDILEYMKEMKAQSKRGVWGLKRRKMSKSKSKNQEKAGNGNEEYHRTSNVVDVDEKIGPKEVLDIDNSSDNKSPSINVACETTNNEIPNSNDIEVEKTTDEKPRDGYKENDTVSEESSQHEDALPQAQTCLTEESLEHQSITDEKDNELRQSEEKSQEVNCSDKKLSDEDSDAEKSQSCPGSGLIQVPQNDFWNEMAEGYLFSNEEEEDENEELGGFSYYADDEGWEEKSIDEELPGKECFEEKLTRLDNYVQNTVRWVSAMFTVFDFLSDFESDNFGLKDLTDEIFHITDPDPVLLSMILNQDSLNSTNLDNLQLCEPKRSYTQISRSEDWTDECFETVSGMSGSTTAGSGCLSLESKNSDKEILGDKVSEQENLNTPDIDPPEERSGEILGSPPSLPENGSISPGSTSKSPEAIVRLGFAQICIRWISRKLGRNRARVAPAEMIGTHVLSSPCLNANKVKMGKPPSPSGSEKMKSSNKCQPEEVKEQNPSEAPGITAKMTETVSSPFRREQAMKQKQTNSSDSLYGEVTVRKRTAKAGSQDWIRFPGRN